MKTLLDKAKEQQVVNRYEKKVWTEEHLDLVIAYLHGEVSSKQIKSVVEEVLPSITWFAASVLFWAVKNNKLSKV